MNRQLPGRTISIGRPVPNTSVYILDNEENPVPRGAPGVMWAGGSCVTRGYLNLPEVTSSKYKLDKFRGDGYAAPSCIENPSLITHLVPLCLIQAIGSDG
jgi:non-ribosomal peptide synthetase component F